MIQKKDIWLIVLKLLNTSIIVKTNDIGTNGFRKLYWLTITLQDLLRVQLHFERRIFAQNLLPLIRRNELFSTVLHEYTVIFYVWQLYFQRIESLAGENVTAVYARIECR